MAGTLHMRFYAGTNPLLITDYLEGFVAVQRQRLSPGEQLFASDRHDAFVRAVTCKGLRRRRREREEEAEGEGVGGRR